MGVNGRAKGARNERDLAKALGAWWGEVFLRTPGSGGWAKGKESVSGDIVSKNDATVFPFSVEAKKVEGWTLEHLWSAKSHFWKEDGWWEQCRRDALGSNKAPLLVFTKNRTPWYVMMTGHTFVSLKPFLKHKIFKGYYAHFKKPGANVTIMKLEEFMENIDSSKLKEFLENGGALYGKS
jgi:hypothetical protein